MTTAPSGRKRRIRIVVRGRVQGVGFRYHTGVAARRAGIGGWVRNRPDGSVEAVFEGPGVAVEEVLGFARRGPPAARVEAVEVYDEAVADETGFSIRC